MKPRTPEERRRDLSFIMFAVAMVVLPSVFYTWLFPGWLGRAFGVGSAAVVGFVAALHMNNRRNSRL